ncbi:TIR domain-containing protein [bacterium]|nr:TIR domain-containing protein [bacterium]
MQTRIDIFVSYAQNDREVAEAVAASLEDAGAFCWIAPRDILPGADYGAEIVRGIASAAMFVLVFSQHADRSPYVLREVDFALAEGKVILPIRIDETKPSAGMDFRLRTVQWVEAPDVPVADHIIQGALRVLAAVQGRETPPAASSPPAAPARPEPRDGDEPPSVAPVTASLTGPYPLPPAELLSDLPTEAAAVSDDAAADREACARLQVLLHSLRLKGQVTHCVRGPIVTTFAVEPAPRARVTDFVRRAYELNQALGAAGVRIEAAAGDGKATAANMIWIEVASDTEAQVGLKPLLSEGTYSSPVAFALGRYACGLPLVLDLAQAAHVLIGGVAGSGKSACLHAAVVSMLMRTTPDEVRLLLIDPKRVEFPVYDGLPQLLAPVISEAGPARDALAWAAAQLDTRYEALARAEVRNLDEYNALALARLGDVPAPEPPLPRLVIAIDELADLMMQAATDVEYHVCRIAQLGRAVGVHLLISTVRPSPKVLTGPIRANIPTRIALKTATAADSRVILDEAGAERLQGRGDMLYFPIGAPEPVRAQGALVRSEDIVRVARFARTQCGPQYVPELLTATASPAGGGPADELYADAEAFVVAEQTATIAALQRHFGIGYARAARLMDELEWWGVVGPQQGSQPRQVLRRPPAPHGPGGPAEDADDDLYAAAEAYVVAQQTASLSALQRRFLIGYARAGRLMDELEQRGVIGPRDGSKPRQVLRRPDPDGGTHGGTPA